MQHGHICFLAGTLLPSVRLGSVLLLLAGCAGCLARSRLHVHLSASRRLRSIYAKLVVRFNAARTSTTLGPPQLCLWGPEVSIVKKRKERKKKISQQKTLTCVKWQRVSTSDSGCINTRPEWCNAALMLLLEGLLSEIWFIFRSENCQSNWNRQYLENNNKSWNKYSYKKKTTI